MRTTAELSQKVISRAMSELGRMCTLEERLLELRPDLDKTDIDIWMCQQRSMPSHSLAKLLVEAKKGNLMPWERKTYKGVR